MPVKSLELLYFPDAKQLNTEDESVVSEGEDVTYCACAHTCKEKKSVTEELMNTPGIFPCFSALPEITCIKWHSGLCTQQYCPEKEFNLSELTAAFLHTSDFEVNV